MLVAIAHDIPLVEAGLETMLEYDPHIRMVPLDYPGHIDVVLFDAYSFPGDSARVIDQLISDPRYRAVVVYSHSRSITRVEEALARGVRGYLAKSIDSPDLVNAIRRVRAGEMVTELGQGELNPLNQFTAGLSEREAEIVELISLGLTNEQIARECYLSINSVKSYIRTAYRKIGIERRSQAVAWGIEHGMRSGVKTVRTRQNERAG